METDLSIDSLFDLPVCLVPLKEHSCTRIPVEESMKVFAEINSLIALPTPDRMDPSMTRFELE
jgi:hypothetical protein